MNSAGRVLAKRYHKFRQLNKYLEIVEDCLPHLQPRDGGVLNVVDFGSGRAYLTFALYHYLVEELQLPVRLTGLDLKEDVVAFCSEMAKSSATSTWSLSAPISGTLPRRVKWIWWFLCMPAMWPPISPWPRLCGGALG